MGQTFFIILNLAEWIAHIRKPEAGVPDMAGFLENNYGKRGRIRLIFLCSDSSGGAESFMRVMQFTGICHVGDPASVWAETWYHRHCWTFRPFLPGAEKA